MLRSAPLLLGAALLVLAPPTADPRPDADRGAAPTRARVIVQAADPAVAEAAVHAYGGELKRRLSQGLAADLPAASLRALATHPAVTRVFPDRPLAPVLDRTAAVVGARWVAEQLGLDGTGVGVAIIDSGITPTHDDLGVNRVAHFVDFVKGGASPYDGYGHGTHVAGIIAGSGYDSGGAHTGIAPGTHLVVLRTLDERGDGFISDAIAALDYAVDQRAAYNIRVINLSVAAGVYESYRTDPLTLAAKRAVDAGIVVVTAAGNLGLSPKGRTQYGGITAPGNAPWVLTVGAASHNGTVDRSDDTVAPFSSLGPSAIDLVAKPDLVAPGVGTASLADPGSALYLTRPGARLWGTVPTDAAPYITLSGTSMAAPVVTGAVALMLQANPSLQPDAVKAILLATAQPHARYNRYAQGAGFLNARAAIELAGSFGDSPADAQRLRGLIGAVQVQARAALACAGSDLACIPSPADCLTADCFGAALGQLTGVAMPPVRDDPWQRAAPPPARVR